MTLTQPSQNQTAKQSESSANDMPIKLKPSKDLVLGDYSFSYRVMGALVLFNGPPTLEQIKKIRTFFDELTDQIIEEKIDGLFSTDK